MGLCPPHPPPARGHLIFKDGGVHQGGGTKGGGGATDGEGEGVPLTQGLDPEAGACKQLEFP